MIKKLLAVIVIAAVGTVVARKVRGQSADSVATFPAVPRRIPAETLEARTEVPPKPKPEPEPEPQPPAAPESPEDRHALRPSPVPRERPMWSPPVEGTSTGKHAFREDDAPGEDDTNR